MPGNIYNLTKRSELKELVSKKKPLIIKFTATWCGPCKRIAPTFNELVEKVKHLVDVVIVDADEGPRDESVSSPALRRRRRQAPKTYVRKPGRPRKQYQ